MPLSDAITAEVGYVKTPAIKITFSIDRDSKGGQKILLCLDHADGRRGVSLATLNRQAFGDLKEVIAQVDAELAKVPAICRNCKTPIHSNTEFAESRGPCPFCGKMPVRF